MSDHAWKAPRLAVLLAAAALLGLAPGMLATSEAGQGPEKAKKQKPRQVLPTGREDAVPPTAEEVLAEQALDQMLSRSTEGLEVIYHEDGTMSVDLEGRFMSVVVAAPGADGKTVASCITGPEALAKLKAPASASGSKPPPARSAVSEPGPAPAPLEEQ